MPRAKRKASETDAITVQPASKKASKGQRATPNKKKNVVGLTSNTDAESTSTLEAQGQPDTGSKAQPAPETSKATSGANKKSSSTKQSSGEVEYVTICRPLDDVAAERRANDEDCDSDEDDEGFTCGSAKCLCGKPPDDNPNGKWIISKGGFEAIKRFQKEAMNRDQDVFGEYHYNDYSGYGFQEAVNNELLAFHKDFTKNKPDPLALWYRITGFAHVIPGPGAWFMCDDAEQTAETIQLLGRAVLVTLDVLEKNRLLNPESKIQDVSLNLAMCLEMVRGWDAQQDELDWRVPMIRKAEASGIILSGPYGIKERVAKLKDEHEGEDADWVYADWKEMFEDFSNKHKYAGSKKLGGTQYDLTKGKKNKQWVISKDDEFDF